MTRDPTPPAGRAAKPTFRATAVRVLLVQAIALAILGLIQAVYNVGAP